MKNALTQSAPPMRGLQELLGDARGEPPDAANILAAAHRARKAKQSGNREVWRDEVNEILYTAQKSQLAQQKTLIDIEKKNFAEIQKLTQKNNNLEQQIFDRSAQKKVIALFESGHDDQAFKILATYAKDAEIFKTLGKHLYRQDLLKAHEGDPEATQRIKLATGVPESQVPLLYFDLHIRPKMDASRQPGFSAKQQQPGQQQQLPGQPMQVPVGVDPMEADRPPKLNEFLMQDSREGMPTINEQMPQMPIDPMQSQGQPQQPMQPMQPQEQEQETVNPLTHSWAQQDYGNYLTFQGKTSAAPKTEPKASDDKQLLEFLIQNGKSPEEALQWLQEFKAESDNGLTGDAALLDQLRQEFPNADINELRQFFQSSASAKPSALQQKIQDMERHLGRPLTEEEIIRISGASGGVVQDDNDKYLEAINALPFEGDRKMMRAITAKLPRERATIAGKSLLDEIELQRGKQLAALQPFYKGEKKQMEDSLSRDPEGFYENFVSGLKKTGKWTEDVRKLIFPDWEVGTVAIANRLLPSVFERDLLELTIQTLDGAMPSRKLNKVNDLSIQTIQLVDDMRELIAQNKTNSKVIPNHILVNMTNIVRWFGGRSVGIDWRPDDLIESQVTVGRLFANFMVSISGATISEPEAERLKSTFAGWDENDRVTINKLKGMEIALQKDIYSIYSGYLGTDRGNEVVELMYHKANAFDKKKQTFRNIRQRIELSRRTSGFRRLSYKDIMDGFTKKAEMFMSAGEQLTKSHYTELRTALSDIRREKLQMSGNPSTVFGGRFSKESKGRLQDWISDADDPVMLFESISDWMPVDLSKRADMIQKGIDTKLDQFEKRYLEALKANGTLTDAVKKKVNIAKQKVANIKRMEILAFRQETAHAFVKNIKAHAKWGPVIDKLEYTDDQIRQLWHDIQKRGF